MLNKYIFLKKYFIIVGMLFFIVHSKCCRFSCKILENIIEKTTEQRKRLRGRPKKSSRKNPEPKIQSLDRAIDVLECIALGGGLTLSEISDTLGQSPSTIYRILTTFAARDILEMNSTSQEWFIGAGSFRTGSAFLQRTGIVERARPMMRKLMAQTGETANLAIENEKSVLFLSQVETHENIRAFFPPGTMSPMHASGIGKVLLAYGDETQKAAYFETENLETFTENTISSKQDLQVELELIKSQGYAFDDEEKNKGMRCVAAPIFNIYGEVVAGISVSGPTARLSLDRIETVCKQVMEQAHALSLGLGNR